MTDRELLDEAVWLLRLRQRALQLAGYRVPDDVPEVTDEYEEERETRAFLAARRLEAEQPRKTLPGTVTIHVSGPLVRRPPCSTCGGTGVYRGPHALVKQKLPCPDCAEVKP